VKSPALKEHGRTGKILNSCIRSKTMNEIRLLFGKAVMRDRQAFLSALRALQAKHGCVIQALDADKVVSEKHLLFATGKALSAIASGKNIAKDPGVEILRYASGERQIERALAMGVPDSTERIALVMASLGDGCSWPDASELSALVESDGVGCSFKSTAVTEIFNISPEEIEAVGEARIPDLVLERVALVETYR
jgi:KEOPS complex subunit Cgi121